MTLVQPSTTEAQRLPGADPKIPEPPSPRKAPAGPLRTLVSGVAWASVGVAVVGALWALVARSSPDLPTPSEGLSALRTLLRYPFYDLGPNDKGLGIQLGVSLVKCSPASPGHRGRDPAGLPDRRQQAGVGRGQPRDPGPAARVIPVDLPRPRDRTSVIGEPAFRMVQERLMALLTAEEPAAA